MVHVEVQSQYDQEFSQRMFIYNYRAFDLYQKPVISLAILGDETKSWRPSYYQYGLGNSQLIFNLMTTSQATSTYFTRRVSYSFLGYCLCVLLVFKCDSEAFIHFHFRLSFWFQLFFKLRPAKQ